MVIHNNNKRRRRTHSELAQLQQYTSYIKAARIYGGSACAHTQAHLQGLGPLLLGVRLRSYGGLAIHPLEHLLHAGTRW